MKNLHNKKILLIICGGIAAYKSLELIRILKKSGCQIKTILTKGALEFITPLSVSSLSNEKVFTDLFNFKNEAEMDHISLSRWADVILFAPVTANKIAQLSHGLAEDLATTVALASDKEIFLAPAMNVRMWENKITKTNLQKLISAGYKIIGPDIGEMACGEYGEGKFSDPVKISKIINSYFKKLEENKHFKALVTAGPTREYIDPVRFITNRSSGKQGYTIAEELQKNGFETTLISGPTNLKSPEGVKIINVNSADEMYKKTIENLPVDVAIFTAAVSDFRAKQINLDKIKKENLEKIEIVGTKDILDYTSKHNKLRPKLVIGFAAETSNLDENSKNKLVKKNCDWIVANDVSNKQIGFDSEYNEVKIFQRNKPNIENISITTKEMIAKKLVEKISNELKANG
jgi:phosphopantothenoylcysteine decarboxylase/phosphopantothenate--cysteine ligase|tara:strand:- start:2226 stop:3437 length:1212 start_codon:yes stop_codon:yes gene_type:complete